MLVVCGILMASRAPTISNRSTFATKRVVPVLLAVMFAIGMLVSQFWLTTRRDPAASLSRVDPAVRHLVLAATPPP